MLLDVLIEFVGRLTTEVCFLLNSVLYIIHSFLTVNYLAVKWTLSLVIGVWDTIIQALFTVMYALECGVEDFACFVIDLIAIARGLLDLLENCVLLLNEALWTLWYAIAGIVDVLLTLVNQSLEKAVWTSKVIGLGVKKVIDLVIGGFDLLGVLFLWTLNLVPRSIKWSLDQCNTWLTFILNRAVAGFEEVLSAPRKLLESCCQLPREVYVGIAVLVATVVLARCFITRRGLRRMVFGGLMAARRHGRALQAGLLQVFSMLAIPQRTTHGEPPERAQVDDDDEDEEEEELNERPSSSSTSAPSLVRKSWTSSELDAECREHQEDVVKTLTEQLERIRESHLCTICQDAEKCIIVLPCRHLCLCDHCVSRIVTQNPMCPICRTRIQKTMRVYS